MKEAANTYKKLKEDCNLQRNIQNDANKSRAHRISKGQAESITQ